METYIYVNATFGQYTSTTDYYLAIH